jgi:Cys-tRNA(Pro) deacylase
MPIMETAVTRALDAASIPYELRPHSKPVFTVEEAARERGVRVAQIVKVMIVRLEESRLVAALIPGDCRLNLKKLAAAAGVRRLTLAPGVDIERELGLTVGAISPMGIDAHTDVYIDATIRQEEIVAVSSGRPDAGVVLLSADLLRVVNGQQGDFT